MKKVNLFLTILTSVLMLMFIADGYEVKADEGGLPKATIELDCNKQKVEAGTDIGITVTVEPNEKYEGALLDIGLRNAQEPSSGYCASIPYIGNGQFKGTLDTSYYPAGDYRVSYLSLVIGGNSDDIPDFDIDNDYGNNYYFWLTKDGDNGEFTLTDYRVVLFYQGGSNKYEEINLTFKNHDTLREILKDYLPAEDTYVDTFGKLEGVYVSPNATMLMDGEFLNMDEPYDYTTVFYMDDYNCSMRLDLLYEKVQVTINKYAYIESKNEILEKEVIYVDRNMTVGEVAKSVDKPYEPMGIKFIEYVVSNENETVMTTSYIDLYAKYDKYPILFNRAYIGADGEPVFDYEVKYYPNGTSWKDIIEYTMPKTNYTFVGWSEDFESLVTDDNDIINDFSDIIGTNISILAKYKEVNIIEYNYADMTDKSWPRVHCWQNTDYVKRGCIVVDKAVADGTSEGLIDIIKEKTLDDVVSILGPVKVQEASAWSGMLSDGLFFSVDLRVVRVDEMETETETELETETKAEVETETVGSNEGAAESEPVVKLDDEKIQSIKDEINAVLGEESETGEKESKGNNKKHKIYVDMKMDDGTYATEISKEILEAVKGKHIELELDMGDYSWTISGKDIDGDALQSINLKVTLDTENIPDDTVKEVAGKNETKQISLQYNGEFGFKAKLNVNVGSKNVGKYGNLYYYNKDGQLEFMNAGKIDKDGNVQLSFNHASEYVVVIGEDMSEDESGSGLLLIVGIIVGVVAIAAVGIFIFMKKKGNMESSEDIHTGECNEHKEDEPQETSIKSDSE